MFPPVCPDVPKYLEVQYKCETHVEMISKIKQTRLPHMESNISDVWGDRKTILTFKYVEDAVRSSILNQNIPTTEEPIANSQRYSNETMKSPLQIEQHLVTNVNPLNISKVESLRRGETIQRIGKNPEHDSLSSPSDNLWFEEGWNVTYHDIVVIIISSSISVILMITTISVIIIKVR